MAQDQDMPWFRAQIGGRMSRVMRELFATWSGYASEDELKEHLYLVVSFDVSSGNMTVSF